MIFSPVVRLDLLNASYRRGCTGSGAAASSISNKTDTMTKNRNVKCFPSAWLFNDGDATHAAAGKSSMVTKKKQTNGTASCSWMAGALTFFRQCHQPAGDVAERNLSILPPSTMRTWGMRAGHFGMTVMRVYLAPPAWETDEGRWIYRQDETIPLSIADKHHIKTIFVIFDDCWNDTYKPASQPAPKPGIRLIQAGCRTRKLLHTDPALINTLKHT